MKAFLREIFEYTQRLNYWYFLSVIFFTVALLSAYAYYWLVASNYPVSGLLIVYGKDFSSIIQLFVEIKVGFAAIFIAAGTFCINLGRNFSHKIEISSYKQDIELVREEKRKLETRTEQVKTAVISAIRRVPPETEVLVEVLQSIFPEVDEMVVSQEIEDQDPISDVGTNNIPASF